MSLTGARFAKPSGVAQLIRDGVERVNALPGVEVAGATCCVPLQGGFGLPFIVVGRPLDGPSHGGGGWYLISPTYFSAFKIPILRGRAFTDRDIDGAPGVVIINQTMARKYWSTGDPLADRVIIGKGTGPQFAEPARQIVGAVRNMVIGQGMRLALVGVAIGVASALGLTRILASFLFGVTARDPMVFVSVPLILSVIALVAVWLPARRAARIDPAVALRYE
jgi:hypothetical protein